ncbi:MAG: hypothetical protein ABFC24_13235 [Methanoregulaceae archaeon]
MQRMECTRCGKEFEVHTGCSCCAPSPGPFFCPDCGSELRRMAPAYYFSGEFEDE